MRTIIYLLALLLIFPNLASASRRRTVRHLHKHTLKTQNTLPELKGSKESIRRQNSIADAEGLKRFMSERELAMAKVEGTLVALPQNEFVDLDERLDVTYRWCLPRTRDFLNNLGEEYFERFGSRIQVNSAVRTMEHQKALRRHGNGNAILSRDPAEWSSHITGATVDITKKSMNPAELRWMRVRLITLENQGLVEATEEFHQLVFHVMVFKEYEGARFQ